MNTIGSDLGISEIFQETLRVMRESISWCLIYALPIIAIGVAVDLEIVPYWLDLLYVLAALILGYLLVKGMLQSEGVTNGQIDGGFGSYFIVALVAGIGVFLGFVLLIIPGIILMVRWMPAPPVATS